MVTRVCLHRAAAFFPNNRAPVPEAFRTISMIDGVSRVCRKQKENDRMESRSKADIHTYIDNRYSRQFQIASTSDEVFFCFEEDIRLSLFLSLILSVSHYARRELFAEDNTPMKIVLLIPRRRLATLIAPVSVLLHAPLKASAVFHFSSFIDVALAWFLAPRHQNHSRLERNLSADEKANNGAARFYDAAAENFPRSRVPRIIYRSYIVARSFRRGRKIVIDIYRCSFLFVLFATIRGIISTRSNAVTSVSANNLRTLTSHVRLV